MQTFVYPEEIFRELAQTSFFVAYTEEQLAQDLAQLEAWGNLTAQQEVARAHNIAEFKRKRFRYQCTPYTVEIERMVERLRGLGDSFGGSLETTQFDRLLSHLSSLLLDAAGQSDEQLLQTWEDLLHYFRTLVENASDYLAHLRSAKVEERMQTSAFLAYKDMFTQYLRSFVLGLQRAAQQVSALLEQAEDETLQAVFGRLADRWHIIHALDESASREAYLAEVRERWQVLREWFLGTEYHASSRCSGMRRSRRSGASRGSRSASRRSGRRSGAARRSISISRGCSSPARGNGRRTRWRLSCSAHRARAISR